MGRLPSISISDDGEELIRAFAASKRISVGNAVRKLLEQSPELIEFAKSKNTKPQLSIQEWGGKRTPKG